MKKVLVLLCSFFIIQGIVSQVDGATGVARGVASDRQSVIILEDDFNDGILDTNKWIHIGISKKVPWVDKPGASVKEANGILTISEDRTDAGGAVKSIPFTVKRGDILKLTREVRIFPKGNFRNTSAFITEKGKPVAQYRYFYKYKKFKNGVYFDYDGKESVVPPWGKWFTEIVTYNTKTGETTYSIPGRGKMSRKFGTLPVSTFQLLFDAYGWFTGHKVEIDYVKLEKLTVVKKLSAEDRVKKIKKLISERPVRPVVDWSKFPDPVYPPTSKKSGQYDKESKGVTDKEVAGLLRALQSAVRRGDEAAFSRLVADSVEKANWAFDEDLFGVSNITKKDFINYYFADQIKDYNAFLAKDDLASNIISVKELGNGDKVVRFKFRDVGYIKAIPDSYYWKEKVFLNVWDMTVGKVGGVIKLKGINPHPKDFHKDVLDKFREFLFKNYPTGGTPPYKKVIDIYNKLINNFLKDQPAKIVSRTTPHFREKKNPPPRLLPKSKVTGKIKEFRENVQKIIENHYPDMKDKLQFEKIQTFNGVDYFIRMFQRLLINTIDGREVKFIKRLVLSVDESGKTLDYIIPILELMDPKQKKQLPPDARWDGEKFEPPVLEIGNNSCMVLTNLRILKAKHGINYTSIKRYLDSFGPVIDISSESVNPEDYRSIDAMLEKRFDRSRYNCLFVFGGNDVVPLGVYHNPVYDIIPKNPGKDWRDPDEFVYSDDYYADFDHDPANDWDVVLTRMPDDKGILADKNSTIYRSVPEDNRPDYSDFVVYGNRNWPVSDKMAVLGSATQPKVLKSTPFTENNFSPSYFEGRNVFINLHGADYDGTVYWGETEWDSVGKGGTPPSEALRNAINIDQAQAPGAIIVSAACYGADIVSNPTSDSLTALRFLRNGARAYIGNTKVGYIAPVLTHTIGLWAKLFKDNLDKGLSPQESFMLAKRAYAKQGSGPHHYKMYHQMIYLGLPPIKSVGKLVYDEETDTSKKVSNDFEKPQVDANLQNREYTWPNGTKYVGEWKGNTMHGQGTLIWTNGSRYEGKFNNNIASGGWLFWSNGQKAWSHQDASGKWITGTVESARQQDQRSSDLEFRDYTWPDGTKYTGQWKGNKMHGEGTIIYPNGGKYSGEWKDSIKSGKGTETWPDGTKYTGQWADNKMHGQGTLTWTNGNRYEGEFNNNIASAGWLFWSNGQKAWSYQDGSGKWINQPGKQSQQHEQRDYARELEDTQSISKKVKAINKLIQERPKRPVVDWSKFPPPKYPNSTTGSWKKVNEIKTLLAQGREQEANTILMGMDDYTADKILEELSESEIEKILSVDEDTYIDTFENTGADIAAAARSAQAGDVRMQTSSPVSDKFISPTINGYRLDWCRVWGGDCGKGAADAFCRKNGYTRAKSFEIDHDIGQGSPTYTIGSEQVCDESFCDGFKYIECEQDLTR